MKPSVALDLNRKAILDRIGRFPFANPRVFGSAIHGTDREGSDLDIVVDSLPKASLFDIINLQNELEQVTGVRFDLVTSAGLKPRVREAILSEAKPI